MDDLLEHPNTLSSPRNDAENAEDAELSTGDEDEGLDWSKLPSSAARPVIPKRGDKDFEPSVHGGSGLQKHVLDRARNAMFDALKAERNTSSKSISYGIWYPKLARTHVSTARGIHFTTMGHSVPRPVAPQDGQQQKVAKRLELLPEEAIYLVERGSMFCWKALEDISPRMNGLEEMEGAPMSVQQVFAEMIGTEDLTLEKYQVFAYLKRLGYVVMRTKAPSPAYLTAALHVPLSVRTSGWFSRLLAAFTGTFSKVLRVFRRTPEFWRPGLFHHGLTYSSMFKSLRVIPSGHSTPLQVSAPDTQQPSIYDIFYNVYKPATPFKKTAPSKPDFQIVVVNARTTPMPTLSELTDLFDILPELPTPVPRRRIPYAEQKNTAAPHVPTQPTATDPTTTPSNPSPSLVHRLFWWALPTPPPVTSAVPIRRPNPFAILKQGKKMVVVAAVDAGAISFFSFRQGGFEEFPMA